MKGATQSHRQGRGATDVWLTPPAIIRALGEFDLDPCTPKVMPWNTAKVMYSSRGLDRVWRGRVWLNPPYQPGQPWLRRLALDHRRGTALVFARTETEWFDEFIWKAAAAVFFLRRRLTFHHPDGRLAKGNGGAPSVLAAYGEKDHRALLGCDLPGYAVHLRLPEGK